MIIKEVFQHWTNKCVSELMDYITSSNKYKYLIVANSVFMPKDDVECIGGLRGLSAKSSLLKKYNLKIAYNYEYIEISILEKK